MPDSHSDAVLAAHDLAVMRGDSELLRGVRLALRAGEAVHLTGPNGSGKTSLLEVFAGLRPPSSGQVERPPVEQRLWLGHRNGLNQALSLQANLELWCGLRGLPADGVAAALERMGLYRQRRRMVRGLSAGQRRRGALATLLLDARARLWLLDEPLAALDAASLPLVGEIMREHLGRGGAVLMSTHQPLPGVRLREVDVRSWSC